MRFKINHKKFILFLLCLQNAAISFNVSALTATIPSISNDLGILDLVASKIIPFYMIPYGLGALLYAPLAKRFSIKTIMVTSMVVFSLANFLCAKANAIEPILILRIITGIAGAGVVPLGLILIGKLYENHVRGRVVGLFFSFSFVAALSGIILSGFASWRWLFLVPSLIGLVAAGCLFIDRGDYLGRVQGNVDYSILFKERKILHIFIFILIISLLYHSVDRWLGVFLSRMYHFNQLTISLLFALIAVSGAVGQNVGGYLTDKKGRIKSCQAGIVMLAAATIALSAMLPAKAVAVIFVVFAAGWSIGHNGISTVLTDFPEQYRSELASLNSSLRFVAGGIGVFISGVFVEKSFGITFLVIGILMLVLALFLKKIIPEET
ncbi:MAG TPA: MFS transporter [Candidatus Omnitrophota bacterium]|nr:MFS transporter [Candidatus Omnitrophota bacterium]HPD85516.1 MFS transporter [Candidatus Omnitrophota bacterium]HRZ04444.1 MFS transporter [Candidatus Omnitrophota bacterium]